MRIAALLCLVVLGAGSLPVSAQVAPRSSGIRVAPARCGAHSQMACAQGCEEDLQQCSDGRCWFCCSDGSTNSVCGTDWDHRPCSGNPADGARFDVDCFTCHTLGTPNPGPASGIHEGINAMGQMFASGRYDDVTMRSVILAYYDGAWWEASSDKWGANALDGYVIWALVMTALEYRTEVTAHPLTARALQCVLDDWVGRDIPISSDHRRRFHGVQGPWNSQSEDFMGLALGYAAADAWDSNASYYPEVTTAVDLAFSISHTAPHTLWRAVDPDPKNRDEVTRTMLRNHGEYSPVYAMVIIKHLGDINRIYQQAGEPGIYDAALRPPNLDGLFWWVITKIESNPSGQGYVFRDDGCQRSDTVLSFCDDRPGDPPGTGGDRREPGHYPLAAILPELGITDHLQPFAAPCAWTGPVGIVQAPHNYYYNCVFTQ